MLNDGPDLVNAADAAEMLPCLIKTLYTVCLSATSFLQLSILLLLACCAADCEPCCAAMALFQDTGHHLQMQAH
jgi:hypothetical protein